MSVKLSEYMPYRRNNTILTSVIDDNPVFQPVCQLAEPAGLPAGEYVLTASWIFNLPDLNDAMIWRFVIDGVVGNEFQAEAKDVDDQFGWSFAVDWQATGAALDIALEARVEDGGNSATVIQAMLSVERKPLA